MSKQIEAAPPGAIAEIAVDDSQDASPIPLRDAIAALAEILHDRWIDEPVRLRAAAGIIEHARRQGAPSGPSDEPSLEAYLSSLGARDPGTPEAFEALAKDLRL